MPRGGSRLGSGRKKSTGNLTPAPTHALRVPTEVSKQDCEMVPSVKAILRYWEDEVKAARDRGESLRTYEKLQELLDEVKQLGF